MRSFVRLLLFCVLSLAGVPVLHASLPQNRVGENLPLAALPYREEVVQVPELRLDNPLLYGETVSRRLFWTKFDPEGLDETDTSPPINQIAPSPGYGEVQNCGTQQLPPPNTYAGGIFNSGYNMDDPTNTGRPQIVPVANALGGIAQVAVAGQPVPPVAGAVEKAAVAGEQAAEKEAGPLECFLSWLKGKFGGKGGDPAAAAPEGSASVNRAVQEGEVGRYGDLKGRSVPHDGLDIHEVPSSAAQIAAKESELGRKLTDAEKTALKADNPAIAIKSETHKLTDTYKGRNTPEKIATDAANRPVAAARGAQDLIQAGKETGVDLTRQANQLKDMTK